MRRTAWLSTALTLLTVAACDAPQKVMGPSGALFDRGGNADAAHQCQQGGWEKLQRSDATLFGNVGECVSYAAQGGTLAPKSQPPVITSFVLDGYDGDYPVFTAVYSGGVGFLSDECGNRQYIPSGVPTAYRVWTGDPYIFLIVTNSDGYALRLITLNSNGCV